MPHSIHLKQGNENKAGVAHSLYRHYDTKTNHYTNDELLFIIDVISSGDITQNKDSIVYTLWKDNTRFRVIIEKYRGGEYFANFMTNRKSAVEPRSKNTDKQHWNIQQPIDATKVE